MFLMSVVVGSRSIVTVAAQTRAPGVSPGDWADYNATYSGNGTMPSSENTLQRANLTILAVSGTNVTFELGLQYADGHENASIYVLNVDTGQGNGTYLVIAGNLNAGEAVYTGSSFNSTTINETISRGYPYPVGTIEVNHLNITSAYSYPGYENLTTSANFYWHQTTGMLTEFSIYQLTQTPSNTTWMEEHVVITDWGSGVVIPEFPPALILLLFMIAIIAAVFLGKTIWSTKKLTEKTSP
jgi:hypothetical protein